MLDAIIILVASICYSGYDWNTFNHAMDHEWDVTTMVTCSNSVDKPGFLDRVRETIGVKQIIIVTKDYPGPPNSDGIAYVLNDTAYVRGNITDKAETVNHEFLHLWFEEKNPANVDCWANMVHLHVAGTDWIAPNIRIYHKFNCSDPKPWGL